MNYLLRAWTATRYCYPCWNLNTSLSKFNKKKCRNPGSNQGPSDLQSDALPTELLRRDVILYSQSSHNLAAHCNQYRPSFFHRGSTSNFLCTIRTFFVLTEIFDMISELIGHIKRELICKAQKVVLDFSKTYHTCIDSINPSL